MHSLDAFSHGRLANEIGVLASRNTFLHLGVGGSDGVLASIVFESVRASLPLQVSSPVRASFLGPAVNAVGLERQPSS